MQSWRCQFFSVISLLCAALHSCKHPKFHKTLTIQTWGRRDIRTQIFNFVNGLLFTNELCCLVITLLLNLPCNQGDTENEYWDITTTSVWLLSDTAMPSYWPEEFDFLPRFLGPTLRAELVWGSAAHMHEVRTWRRARATPHLRMKM